MWRRFRRGGVGGVVVLALVPLAFIPVRGDVHYVDANTSNAIPPYTNWATAAAVIQAAVDLAVDGDTVLVSNGVYDTGGAAVQAGMTNRVTLTNAISLLSVGGADRTFIVGAGPGAAGAVRCAYVGSGARLHGFTLTNGHTTADGGGAWCESDGMIANCVVTECEAGGDGGGVHGGRVADSEVYHCIAGEGGGAAFADLSNTVVAANWAVWGGGTHHCLCLDSFIGYNVAESGAGGTEEGTNYNCVIVMNEARGLWNTKRGDGGGTFFSVARGCVISDNEARDQGGGAYFGTLHDCVIRRNTSGHDGGGAYNAELRNCDVIRNAARRSGGGTAFCSNVNCIVMGNLADWHGGGGYVSDNLSCTLVANTALSSGGGGLAGTYRNCIVYYNTAGAHDRNLNLDSDGVCEYSCTVPDPGGTGNIESAPLLLGLRYPGLLPASPCIDAGTNQAWMATGVDMHGEPRVAGTGTDMGCDEYHADGMTGRLDVAFNASASRTPAGSPVHFETEIQGRAEGFAWDFGDGTHRTNVFAVDHRYDSAGDYAVTLTAWNGDGAVSATGAIEVLREYTTYVSASSTNATHPYTNWSMAADNIQDAIDASIPGGRVLVTNGVYASGGHTADARLTNRVAITQAVTVVSVNGPEVTSIAGRGPIGNAAVRGVYVGHGAVLAGFTVSNGHTMVNLANNDLKRERSGGGIRCEPDGLVSNCILTANRASNFGGGISDGVARDCLLIGNTAGQGAGSAHGRLASCILVSNVASYSGGAAFDGTLDNCFIADNRAGGEGGGTCYAALRGCTVVRNAASGEGGGMCQGSAHNSILYDNASSNLSHNYFTGSSAGLLMYCCTTPLPDGTGNLTNEPALAAASPLDHRLSWHSPCIDAGLNDAGLLQGGDLAGNPRVFNGTVDIGAHEFTMATEASLLLAGPYDSSAGCMAVTLAGRHLLPTNSPYAAAVVTSGPVPTNVTDWILLELLTTNGLRRVATMSGMLREDGVVTDVQGRPELRLEVSPGYYYLAGKHRNHCTALSALPVAFTNATVAYDFTAGPHAFYGGTNACVNVDSGRWALIPGDADGNGEVTDVDRRIVVGQLGKTGYLAGDLNLDAAVTADD